MPSFAQASTIAMKSPCLRTVAVLIESQRWSLEKSRIKSGSDAPRLEYEPHALGREIGIAQQTGLVRQPENVDEMQGRTRAFLPADHGEMILMSVEIGHEHHAGLVETCRRAEDVARQR